MLHAYMAGVRPAQPRAAAVAFAAVVLTPADALILVFCPPIAGIFKPLTQVAPGDRCTKMGELAAEAASANEEWRE